MLEVLIASANMNGSTLLFNIDSKSSANWKEKSKHAHKTNITEDLY